MTDRLRVLVVDDDREVRRFLEVLLESNGMAVVSTAGVDDATRELERHPRGHFDALLLDVMMPDKSGWELLRDLRAAGDETPIIFVTSSGEVEHRVRGLSLGADDYVSKPFTPEELLARMRAVVRRRRSLPVLVHCDLRLSLADRVVERSGRAVAVSPTEFDVLRLLVEARGGTVSRQRLLREVWGLDFDPGTTVLEVLIGRLRRKVDRRARPLILTVHGEGYRLADPKS